MLIYGGVMLKKLLIIISISFLFTQDQSIANLTVGQLTDGSGLIAITYDIIDEEGTFASFNIEVQVSIDGSEFATYSGSEVSGDVGENVIPGVGRIIYIQAPDETYSNNVVAKIIATAYTVTSELPFTMITISSIEGVSSYQEETISYNYEIMQNEMTNAELVTFLETYDFQLDADDAPIYNCNEYAEYYNTGIDGEDTYIGGCMEEDAINYNPSATDGGGYECVYESDIGCTDYGAYNHDDGTDYNDCSCYFTNSYSYGSDSTSSCSWSEMCSASGEVAYNCNYNPDQDLYYIDITGDGVSEFQVNEGAALVYQACADDTALNYPSEAIGILYNIINGFNIDPDCLIIADGSDPFDGSPTPDNNSCVYECDQSYLDIDDGEGGDDYESVNIQDFSTQAISFEGSSFVIESGLGTQPAILNYENCVDGIVVGLLLDHYGLRIPTGGEWTKAAREDNTRCWPWFESDCDAAAETYCNSIYTCMSDEEFEACQEGASDLFLDCQLGCNDTGSDVNCADIHADDLCEGTDGCTWDETFSYCQETCYACMMDNSEICGSDPMTPGCPCETDCMGDGGFDEMMECMNDCGDTYGNTWEYCNGQDVNDCNNCTMNTQACEGVDTYNLAEFLDDSNYDDDDGDGVMTSDYDYYGFYRHLFLNKFHYYYDADSDQNAVSIEISDIAQYPEGISPFGLYDMIGNAPEVVKYDNNLWLVGINPFQDYIGSFCEDGGTLFNEESGNGHATGLSINAGYYYNLYGLRLARTTQ